MAFFLATSRFNVLLRKEWRKNAELMLKLKRSRFICEIYGIFEDKNAYFAPLLKRYRSQSFELCVGLGHTFVDWVPMFKHQKDVWKILLRQYPATIGPMFTFSACRAVDGLEILHQLECKKNVNNGSSTVCCMVAFFGKAPVKSILSVHFGKFQPFPLKSGTLPV